MNSIKVFDRSNITFSDIEIGSMVTICGESNKGVFMKIENVKSTNCDTMDWDKNAVQLSTGKLWTISDEDEVDIVNDIEICHH